MYKCCFCRYFNLCAFCYEQCWEHDGCILLQLMEYILDEGANATTYLDGITELDLYRWFSSPFSNSVFFHDSFLSYIPFYCSSFAFFVPMYCRSIVVAAISCILLLLPACSLGAVMCGSMDRGCGGHCPYQLRTLSQRSNISDTAAKILLRCEAFVHTWFIHCSWKLFLYLNFSFASC